ncbi:MAG: hypothetical protein ABL998_03365 [Planctomycetota bacterium]
MSHRNATAALLGLCALACGESAGPRVEIEAARTATRAFKPVLPGATSPQRFGPDERPASDGADDPASAIAYDLPPGWEALRGTRERLIDLRPAGDPEASCYVTFLPGGGGGLEPNVNRWIGQFGGEPLSGEEIAALPTHAMLGRDATLVEVQGNFGGMDGAPRPGFALLGLILSDPSGGIFLKFTAPAARVAAERTNFFALASSLRLDQGEAEGGEHTHEESAGSASGLAFAVPAGWHQSEPRPMREVNFTIAHSAETECYITRLGGDGGGLLPNLNRWRGQFGEQPLSSDELAALEKVTMLGQEVTVLEVGGDFTGMDGKPRTNQGMLGVAWIGNGESLFVKLVGAKDVVHAERANFIAFVQSLKEDG